MTSNADFIAFIRSVPPEQTEEFEIYASLSPEEQDAFVMRPVREVNPDTHEVNDEGVFMEAFGTGVVALIDNVDRTKAKFQANLEKCESPIERRLYAALCGISYSMYSTIRPVRLQVAVGKYRADFMIEGRKTIAIECDGHDYHERTKDQARRDKARDRFFASKGVTVVRFTGSEIWANPVRCAEQAFHVAGGLL